MLKKKHGRAAAKEKVQVAVMASYRTDGKLDYKELKTNLDKIEGIENVPNPEITEESFGLKDDKYVLTVKVDVYIC